MKIVEELYYHNSFVPKYLSELKVALRESGIMPPQEPKTVYVNIKDDIKKTDFWQNSFIFVNKRKQVDRSEIKDIKDIDILKSYGPVNLRTGFTKDTAVFEDESKQMEDKITKQYELKSFQKPILRKALYKLEFYKFDNLKKYLLNHWGK